jgi:hypothetical protein
MLLEQAREQPAFLELHQVQPVLLFDQALEKKQVVLVERGLDLLVPDYLLALLADRNQNLKLVVAQLKPQTANQTEPAAEKLLEEQQNQLLEQALEQPA